MSIAKKSETGKGNSFAACIGYGDRHLDNIVFEKRFTNSSFVQCIDRDVGFFEAWVSVFDGVLSRNCRLSILALAGETECGCNGVDLSNPTGERGT